MGKLGQRIRQEHQPDIDLIQSQLGPARRDTRKEVRSLRGASRVAAQVVRGTSLKGLKGRYRAQVKNEIAGRSSDILRSTPLTIAAARTEGKEALSDIYQQLAGEEADIQTEIIKAKHDRADDRAEFSAEVKEAMREAHSILSSLSKKERLAFTRAVTIKDSDGNNVTIKPEDAWGRLLDEIAGAEGIGKAAARKVVKRLFRQSRPKREASNAIYQAGQILQQGF